MKSELSELDVQNLRHLIGGYDTTHCKMNDYANNATLFNQFRTVTNSIPNRRYFYTA